MGMGGGGASSDIYNDGGTGYYHTNGKNGIEQILGEVYELWLLVEVVHKWDITQVGTVRRQITIQV